MSLITVALAASAVLANPVSSSLKSAEGPYKVLNKAKVGGEGGFDYVYADSVNRKLYVARTGSSSRISVFNLDSLASSGEIANTRAHGAVSDAKFSHSFGSSKPVSMWDSKSLAPIKSITVDGSPDGMLHDDFNHRVYVFSHQAPNVTVIDAKNGDVLGTIDLGGAPEQAATDGKGHIYVDIEDKAAVAVIDAKEMKVTNTFSLGGKAEGCAGLALDAKSQVLFVGCREPALMVMMDAKSGKVLDSLPIGGRCDGVVFNPKTQEAFSSQGDGTLTIIKETSPTNFAVEQTLMTTAGAKTCTFDPKTGKIFLIAAEYGPAPEAAAGEQRRPRAPMIPGSFTIWVVGR